MLAGYWPQTGPRACAVYENIACMGGKMWGVSLADTTICQSWAEQAGRACQGPSALVPARLGSAPIG